VTNTSYDLTFDPVEPPVGHFYSAQKKKETLTVSMVIHKGAIFQSIEDKGNFGLFSKLTTKPTENIRIFDK
jgi:hypothetical protein